MVPYFDLFIFQSNSLSSYLSPYTLNGSASDAGEGRHSLHVVLNHLEQCLSLALDYPGHVIRQVFIPLEQHVLHALVAHYIPRCFPSVVLERFISVNLKLYFCIIFSSFFEILIKKYLTEQQETFYYQVLELGTVLS